MHSISSERKRLEEFGRGPINIRAMRILMRALFFLFVPSVILCAEGNDNRNQTIRHAESSPMKQLRASFRRAKPPLLNDLHGDWIVIRIIDTEKFLKGYAKDPVEFDEHGIRANKMSGGFRWAWKLIFKANRRGNLQLIQDSVLGYSTSAVNFNSGGDLIFEAPDGEVPPHEVRCRTVNSLRLVCLRTGHEQGIEFMKTKPDLEKLGLAQKRKMENKSLGGYAAKTARQPMGPGPAVVGDGE